MKPWCGYDMPATQAGRTFPDQHSDVRVPNKLLSYAEADAGVIYVIGRGFWTDNIVNQHFAELRRTASLVRRQSKFVRVLVNLRLASVQSPAVAGRIKEETRLIWTDRDRIAVVLQSVLAKLQIDRIVSNGNHASFIAIEDARKWLGLRQLERLANSSVRP